MDIQSLLTALLMLVAGIGVFLVACQTMSHNLESAGSDKLKKLFEKASGSRLLGVGIGALGTAAIQSSGAVTVMVIGFVNVGIMSLTQAATIIYGANIGTTITAQIVALGLGGGGISTTTIFAAFAGLGVFMSLLAKKDIWRKVGGILTGFGMLFVGLHIMSGSMGELAKSQEVMDLLASVSNGILLVLIGAIFTAIIQSSSVTTSIAITMVMGGLINLNQGIYLTLGSNIGSCVVALIAGLTSGKNAKRTSMIHLLFNCFGVLIFMLVAECMELFSGGAMNFGVLMEEWFPVAAQWQMAMFHTIFNVATVIIILPLTDVLVSLVCKMIPEPKTDEQHDAPHFFFVDDAMMSTPIIAVRQVQREIEHMAAIAMLNYNRSVRIISSLDMTELPAFQKDEEQLNWLNHELVRYIVRLNQKDMSEGDHNYLSKAIKTVSDVERIGDYAENITEYAAVLKEKGEQFSDVAKMEIAELRDKIQEVYEWSIKAYAEHSREALNEANIREDEVDELSRKMEVQHIVRMNAGECTPSLGAQYLEFSSDSERIADHLINVAKTIRES
mgnify:CR=1 FL=1